MNALLAAVLERVRDPKYVGWLPRDAPDVGTGEAGTLERGTMTRIQVRVGAEPRRIDDAVFKVFGCSAAIASASLVTERLQRRDASRTRRAIDALDDRRGAGIADRARERRGARGRSGAGRRSRTGKAERATMIEISDSAARVITRQLTNKGLAGGGLRVAVKAGGCSGFSYVFNWDAHRARPTTSSKAPAARRSSSTRAV